MRIVAFLIMVLMPALVEADCFYQDETGEIRSAKSRQLVPIVFRDDAKCQGLVEPEDVSLSGNLRRERFSTPIGRVELRWPRRAEELFGTTPNRAVIDAMRTVRKVLRTAGVVPHKLIPSDDTEWQVVVIDGDVSEDEIPRRLISHCHPGWMVPPAKIYLVAQAVAKGCGGKSSTKESADIALTKVLLHELGHVVEYHLLGEKGRQMSRDRARAEGFAAWFEQYSSDYSTIVPHGQTRREYLNAAASALRRGYNPSRFRGSFYDYGIASARFRAIELKGGFRRIIRVYDAISEDNLSFSDAVDRVVYWNEQEQVEQMLKVLEKY